MEQSRNITLEDLIPNVTLVNTIFDDSRDDWDTFLYVETYQLNSNGQRIHPGQREYANSENQGVPLNLDPASSVTTIFLRHNRIRVLPWVQQSATGDGPIGGTHCVTLDQIRKIKNP